MELGKHDEGGSEASPRSAPPLVEERGTSVSKPPEPHHSLWRSPYGAATVGIFSLAFLIAFESFAVITALPLVVRDLDGLSWYAVSFAAPIAISLISLTFAGAWCDASGPLRPMVTGVIVFSAGLVVAGTAPTMPLSSSPRIDRDVVRVANPDDWME